MLLIFEKVLQLMVKSQIEMFSENNEIITEHLNQALENSFSCETTIQTVIDKWKLIVGERKMVIFMDLK